MQLTNIKRLNDYDRFNNVWELAEALKQFYLHKRFFQKNLSEQERLRNAVLQNLENNLFFE